MEILKYWDIEKYFEEVICGDDSFPQKPDSSSYEYVHNKYEVDLVIGDRNVDLIAARKLGIQTCLYNNPEVEADIHIDCYNDFLKKLKEGL